MVLMGMGESAGGEGWQEYQLHSSPQGPRYVEAAGRGEQVHGNSQVVAYSMHVAQTSTENYGLRKK